MYEAETWAFCKDRNKLIGLKNRICIQIFDPEEENKIWNISMNQELRTSYKSREIVAQIDSKRIRWAGRVWRRQVQRRRMLVQNSSRKTS